MIPAEIEQEIQASRRILALPSDWDDAGSPAFRQETWDRAVALLRSHAEALARQGMVLPAPRILPGPDGSIDLHWITPRREMLLNVPEALEAQAGYYGDAFSGYEARKGGLLPGAVDLELFSWLAEEKTE